MDRSRCRRSAGLLLAVMLLPAAATADGEMAAMLLRPPASIDSELADHVIVRKSERKLYLMRSGEVLRSHEISLGRNPVGHKEKEGDFRTPEGRYRLDWRNPYSAFYMAIHVSYPNQEDLSRARSRGIDPGGMIMIHGLPNEPKYAMPEYRRSDWTDGCIAVSNSAMIDIWLSVADDTPITILP